MIINACMMMLKFLALKPLFLKSFVRKIWKSPKLLVDKGADINFTKEGMEPIYLYFVGFFSYKNLKFLLHHGYNNYIYFLKKCILLYDMVVIISIIF